jgi:hypothetical protein
MVLVGLVFAAVLGYSLHRSVPDTAAANVGHQPSEAALDRLRWHLQRAESVYAVVFRSRRPDGEGSDVCFRATLEESLTCKRELLEDPSGMYSDVCIALITRKQVDE